MGRIVLTWSAPSGADSSLSYRIEHSSDGQSWGVLDASYDGLTYTDDGRPPATLQYYRVGAVKDSVISGWAYAQATTKIKPGATGGPDRHGERRRGPHHPALVGAVHGQRPGLPHRARQ